MEALKATSVTIVWLSGKEEEIGEFQTVGHVKLHLLKTTPEAFLPECVVLAPDYEVLDFDAEVLPVMHVIFQETKPRKNMQEWREAITLHHKLEGFEGIKRIGRRIERDGFIDVADVFERQREFRVFLAVQTQDVNRLCDLVGYESHLNLPGIYTLVAAKGDPNADIGGSILLHAIYNRDLEAVNFLIEHEVNVSLPGNHWCKERLLPLNAAADLASCGPGDLSIVRALLGANASVHQRGPNDKTVLEHFIESQRWMHQMPDGRMTRLMKVHYLLEEARRSTPLPEGERDISTIRFDLFPPKSHKQFPYKWEDNNTLITSRVLDLETLEGLPHGSPATHNVYNGFPKLVAGNPPSINGKPTKAQLKMRRDSRRHMLYSSQFVGRGELGKGERIIHQRWKVLENPGLENVKNVSTGAGGSSSSSIGMNEEDVIAIPYRGRSRLSVYEDNLTAEDANVLSKNRMKQMDGGDTFLALNESNNQNEESEDQGLKKEGPLTAADHALLHDMTREVLEFLSEP